MVNDPFDLPLREQAWRRKLTPAEEEQLRAWLAAHPEARTDWQHEAALNEALAALPNVPVPGNFTARVLQSVAGDAEAEARRGPSGWFWRPRIWLPRVAFAAVLVTVGLASYHRVTVARRVKLAQSVVAVSDVSSLPSPEILTNFDAILALNQAPAADEQLLALMK